MTALADKKYCMSSYMALRYIEDDNKDFYETGHHQNTVLRDEERILVKTADDIDREIARQVAAYSGKRKGLLLSGGMDSAILASYLEGADAYTFRSVGGGVFEDECRKAKYYAEYYGLNLHYVDISWNTVDTYLESLMRAKCAPVHSIGPQILQAALSAKEDGVEVLFTGESADIVFGGMDGLLSRDWTVDEFANRYMFTNPQDVLVEAESMQYVFERYRKEGEKIDFLRFMNDIFMVEALNSYLNAFKVAGIQHCMPYSKMKMGRYIDLSRIRNGESKYLIRELMAKKYPEISVPDKLPMPRPVDEYFKSWSGPTRPEFKKNLDMSKFTGDQKWQMYCLERYLDMNEPRNQFA